MKEEINELISNKEISDKIDEIAEQINRDYAGKKVTLLCILKGSVFFTCELAKRLTVPVEFEFMTVSSYGDGIVSSGAIRIIEDDELEIRGDDVLVIEDIVDTGSTLSFLLSTLAKRGPASLKLCALLDKPSRRVKEVDVDYVGFEIPDKFVVGFGMDYAQKYRNLDYIGELIIKED
ncbi:MAG: hypoxanthine phosphoribosyltransferase [Eubacterium sp.]|nr:hypoxanthine phosphoribosyltransferase [Eubacterium sp.]